MQFFDLIIGKIVRLPKDLIDTRVSRPDWERVRFTDYKGRTATIIWEQDGTSVLGVDGTNSKGEPIAPAYGRLGRETSC